MRRNLVNYVANTLGGGGSIIGSEVESCGILPGDAERTADCSSTDLGHVLDLFFSVLKDIPFNRLCMSELDEEKNSLLVRWCQSTRPMHLGVGHRGPVTEALRQVLHSRSPRIIEDLGRYAESQPESAFVHQLSEEGMQTSLACPVQVRGEVAALLTFSSVKPQAFSQEHSMIAARLARVVGTVLERTRLGDQLVRTQRDMDRFFQLSTDLLCVANTDGYFRTVSASFERVLGHSMRVLLETPFVEFVHPEDREATRMQVERLRDGERTVAFENRYRCGDGRYLWLEWNAVPLPEEDAIYAVARDITASKELNHKLRAVVCHAPIAMVMVDPDNRISDANRHLEDIFGFGPGELLGQSVESLMPERFRADYESLRQRLETRGGRLDLGVRGKLYGCRKDGTEVPVEISATSLNLGTPHLLVAVTDVTLRHRAMKRVRSIVEAATDGILLVDHRGRVRFHNHVARRIFGHTEKHMASGGLTSLVALQYREATIQAVRTAFAQGDREQPIRGDEIHGLDYQGHEVPLEMSFRSIEVEDERLVLVTIQDLSAQQRIQREFAVAREVQRALVPKDMPDVPGFDILAESRPAEATCGDFFNFTSLENGDLVLAIGGCEWTRVGAGNSDCFGDVLPEGVCEFGNQPERDPAAHKPPVVRRNTPGRLRYCIPGQA